MKYRLRFIESRLVVREVPALSRQVLGQPITCADEVADALPFLTESPVEEFWALLLDGKHRLTSVYLVSRGTLTFSLVHPREVFGPAIRESAAAIVVAHNHPSGDSTPSLEDKQVTERLQKAGELLGIPLLDHVILGDGRNVSLRAQGVIS